jgi:hypothetical protein
MKKILSSIIVMSVIIIAAIAQKPAVVLNDKEGWHKIGETTVNFKTDKDNIVVIGADKFRAIKFKVMDAAIDLQDLEVYYENEKGNNSTDKKETTAATNADGSTTTVTTTTKTNQSDNSAKSPANYESIQVRTPITAGMESRVIELKGGERELKRVVFTYKTMPNEKNEKAVVELWGLK